MLPQIVLLSPDLLDSSAAVPGSNASDERLDQVTILDAACQY
jgi:hypothetical protein